MRFLSALCCLCLTAPAWAAHPLITDDPGTVAPGGIEYEQIVDIEEAKGISEAATTFTFGITDNFDAGISVGYDFEDDTGATDPALGTKWRFIGDAASGLSIALSTAAVLASGFERSELIALILGEYRMADKAILFNAGRTWVRDDMDHYDWGIAYETNTSPYMKLVTEATNHDFLISLAGQHDELEYLTGFLYTDSNGYVYSAGLGYRPNEDVSHWRLTTGLTITF